MDLVDKFLASVTDEYGNKIDFSNVESEGFEGDIYFGSNYAEIAIKENQFWIGNNQLNIIQKSLINAFIKYVQQKMKEHKAFLQDDINTKNDLYYNL